MIMRAYVSLSLPYCNHNILFQMAQGVIRCIMEIIFVLLQVHLYGFTVYNNFPCAGGGQWEGSQNPCPAQGVVCWVSRAMEKTIFLRFMFTMSIISILMTLIELYQLTWRKCIKFSRSQLEKLGYGQSTTEMTSTDQSSSKFLRYVTAICPQVYCRSSSKHRI